MKIITCLGLLLLPSLFCLGQAKAAPADAELIQQIIQAKKIHNEKQAKNLLAHADEITGLELIIAAAPSEDGPFYSQWGHAMLRFVRGSNPLQDILLSFSALVDEASPSLMKGVFGGYPVLPELNPLSDFWLQYVRNEGRPLDRYILVTTPQMRSQLLKRLESWLNHPEEVGSYTFFSNNCAGALLRLLNESLFPDAGGSTIIPSDLPETLLDNLVNLYPKLLVQTPKPLFQRLDQLLLTHSWSENAIQWIEENFSDKEIKLLLQEKTDFPSNIRSALSKKHNYRQGATLLEVMGLGQIPEPLYQTCGSFTCVRKILELSRSLWSAEELKAATQHRVETYRDELTHNLIATRLEKNPAIYDHFRYFGVTDLYPEYANRKIGEGK